MQFSALMWIVLVTSLASPPLLTQLTSGVSRGQAQKSEAGALFCLLQAPFQHRSLLDPWSGHFWASAHQVSRKKQPTRPGDQFQKEEKEEQEV